MKRGLKRGLRWSLLIVLVTAVVGGAASLLTRTDVPNLRGTSIDDPPNVRDVTLMTTSGDAVRLGDWQGDMLLVFFGYANCPDVCPLTMAKLAGTYRRLGEPAELQVLMVTVDPLRDTNEVLKQFVEGFHPDFTGLTGTPDQIANASARFYATSLERPDGQVAHSSHVTLVDRDGRMRVIYNQDKLDSMLQQDLETLLAHSGAW